MGGCAGAENKPKTNKEALQKSKETVEANIKLVQPKRKDDSPVKQLENEITQPQTN